MTQAQGAAGPSTGHRRLALVGWPVAHSRSPAMQNRALAAAGLIGWSYEAMAVPPERFADCWRELTSRSETWRGFNVTIPHKRLAYERCTRLDPPAKALGAVNTVCLTPVEGDSMGYNTDFDGCVELLRAGGVDPPGKSAMVFGAGGAARASIAALIRGGVARVEVVARRVAAARLALAELSGGGPVLWPARAGPPVEFTALEWPDWRKLSDTQRAAWRERVRGTSFLVNASPLGMHDTEETPIPLEWLSASHEVIDWVYHASTTAMTRAARALCRRTIDGWDLLVAQGARSFELWTGLTAPRVAMRQAAQER